MKNNIEKIFEELKSKGLINEKINLISKKSVMPFKTTITNKILYDPSFVGISPDSIRFILLHEAGHARKVIQIGYLALFISLLLYLIGYLVISKITTFSWYFVVIICLFLFFIVFRMFIPLLKKDEIEADSFAAKKILEGYNNKKPSLIIKQVFKELRKKKFKSNILRTLLMPISYLIEYHPTNKERITNLIKIEKGQATQFPINSDKKQ